MRNIRLFHREPLTTEPKPAPRTATESMYPIAAEKKTLIKKVTRKKVKKDE